MTFPSEDETSELYRIFGSLFEPGQTLEVWFPLECYEAVFILQQMLDEHKMNHETPLNDGPTSTNPD